MNPYKAITCLFFLLTSLAQAQDELKVIQPQWVNFTDGPNALYKHVTQEAIGILEKRDQTIAEIESLEDWKNRKQWTKQKLVDVVGPFPEKTALNPEITKVSQQEGYTLEHIVFESQPNFFVSSTLFVPDGLQGKAPAIIYCSGHTLEGYRSATYQHVILNLVKKGFIVFAFDPVGQGERLEYFEEDSGEPTIGGPTKQHSYPGAQAFIAGSSQARYMIWDGIRAVDYLLTREEVDPDRIGITGRSGGGTQSSYIAAFDDRIYVSAPENYITNFKRLLLTHGPQDAEQNFFHGIAEGLDHPDLLLVRAPKPNMMITTSRDIFNIEGARETANQVRRIYSFYRKEDNFLMVEDDAAHASTLKNREAMYAFFQKHLELPGEAWDEQVDTLSRETLTVTSTGQVLTSYAGETVFSLNKKESSSFPLSDTKANTSDRKTEVNQSAARLSGYKAPQNKAETMLTGRIQRDGYVIEKYLMKGEGDYWLPYLLMKPEYTTKKAVIYLDPEGKAIDAAEGGEMEMLVKSGSMVLAPDLLNIGEMGTGAFKGDSNFDGVSYNVWFGSLLIGRSIVGIQAGEVNRMVQILQENAGAEQVFGLAKGPMSAILLHAANFNSDIEGLALLNPLRSYKSIVHNGQYDPFLIDYTVAGALPSYDLPDLLEALEDRKLLLMDSDTTMDDLSKHVQENHIFPDEGQLKFLKVNPAEKSKQLKAWLE